MIRFYLHLLISVVISTYALAQGAELAADQDADSSAIVGQPHLVLKFDRLLIEDMRLDDTLSLIMTAPNTEIAGFSIKFGLLSRHCEIVDVLRGELLDSCQWEFFHARPRPIPGIDERRGQLWTVTALAKTTPNNSAPRCLGLNRPVSLLRVVISNEGIPEVPDHTAPLFFFWENCGDNLLSGAEGRLSAISNDVYPIFEVDLPTSTEALPSLTGTPESCINPDKINRPQRLVDFYNGGVQFKLNTKVDHQDSLPESR